MQALAPHLKGLTSLKKIYLENNQLDDVALEALAPYLKSLPNLTELWLKDNQITDTGAQVLVKHLNGIQGRKIKLFCNTIRQGTKFWIEGSCPCISFFEEFLNPCF